MKKLRFIYLLQAGERNFAPQILTTWEEPFRGSLYWCRLHEACARARVLKGGRESGERGERAFAGSRLGSEIANSLSGTPEAPGVTSVICHQVWRASQYVQLKGWWND